MCGIVGARTDWLTAAGLVPAAAMQRAVDRMRWRGPDDQGLVAIGNWWLGCARLAISGPNKPQPVVRRGGRFAGVMNGAITNQRELWRELRAGVSDRRVLPNDAWLPLLAVAEGRPELLARLRGHHAYAVVDREGDRLVIGQDHYGQKPLHVVHARVDDTWRPVAFASTLPALRELGIDAPVDDCRAAEWFRYGWFRQRPKRLSTRLRLDSVPFRGVPISFPAGARVADQAAAAIPRPAESEPALRRQLVQSVRDCTDTPSPIGLCLSGGLDSSCLALALGELGQAVPAYQFRADHARDDERQAARAVARAAGLPLRLVGGGPELLDALPRLTALAGMPLGDPSILAAAAVARAAADDGVRVLLGGEGADELFLGYRRYRALRRLPQLRAPRRFVPGWSMRRTARLARAIAAHNPVRALLAVTPPAFGSEVLAPHLGARRCWEDAEPLATAGQPLPLAARADDLANYLPRDLLPKIDIAWMAAGIEGRCPYLERSIAAHGESLASLGKQPLRAAFADDLPPAVLALPKIGFALPLDDWFRGSLPLLDLLAEPRTRQRNHLRPGGLARAVDRHRQHRSDLGHGLYLLAAFEIYLRDREASRSLAD